MKQIHVNLGKDSYDIQIEKGLLDHVGAALRKVIQARTLAVISDDTVDGLYGGRLERSLQENGFTVRRMVFPAGESSKSLRMLANLYQGMADAGLTRSDAVITFGGGVTGDLGGFAAATYLRGIPFIQIPTTIIAQVDSSVGGKVAVDLPSGKNQAGSFYQPKAVFIDPELLQTLPIRFIHDGMGEVIKYGCIRDRSLFELLETVDDNSLPAHWEEIIGRCCAIKAAIVERDVFDLGERMILNFGHTIGHAVERYYSYGCYTHGEGVAVGMAMLTCRTEAMGLTQIGTAERIIRLLKRYSLPAAVRASASDLLPYIGHDKKKRGSRLTFIILKKIGVCELLPVAGEDIPHYIRKREFI